MRRTIIASAGIGLLALSACSASVTSETPDSPAASATTQSPAESQPSETAETTESTESVEPSEPESASDVSVVEKNGKLLLTMEAGPQDETDLHGKIVVGQGGCISFVPVPGGGRPLPILAPSGADYDGENTVTIGSASYRFGEVVDLSGIEYNAGEELDQATAGRCDTTNVMWLTGGN